jgi:ribosomal protein S18 acetylase RimI-like enzyme
MSQTRVLTVDDASLFMEIRRSSLRTDPDSFSARPETDAWSKLETARQRFLTASPENGPVVLGAFESNLIGVIGLLRSSVTAVRIWGFYVRPDCRGGGTGRALVQHALEIARQMPSVVRVELGVGHTSTAARHVYEQCGFHETAFDAETGTHEMSLELAPEAG